MEKIDETENPLFESLLQTRESINELQILDS